MPQTFLPAEWLKNLSDPYAVLGVAVTADEKQILNRYHLLAKTLHPDRYTQGNEIDKKFAIAIFTCLINPAYQQLKNKQERNNIIETIRQEAIAWRKQAKSAPNLVGKQLMEMSAKEADLFYQQAIAAYAERQYKSLPEFHKVTQQIIKLNLVYLSLHQSESIVMQVNTPPKPKEKSRQAEAQTTEIVLNQKATVQPAVISYAKRHYERALQYAKQGQWSLAVPELRDAIKIEPNNSDYYALLGFVHLRQNFLGMARVYTRQALKLNPQQELALKYAKYLKIEEIDHIDPPSMAKAIGIAGLLTKFFTKLEINLSQVLKSR